MKQFEAIIKRRILTIVSFIMTIQGMISFMPQTARAATTDGLSITFTMGDNLPPEPITDLSASTNGTEGQVLLDWTAPSEDNMGPPSSTPATLYVVRYATFSVQSVASTTTWWNNAINVAGEPAPQLPGSAQSQLLNSLEPGATLWFAIKSEDEIPNESPIDDNASSPALQATAVVPDEVPTSPTGLTGTAGDGQVSVSWNAVAASDLDFYRVYVGTNPAPRSFTNFMVDVDSVSVNTVVGGLTNGTQYYFIVTAIDKGAPSYVGNALESASSNLFSVIAGLVPNAPTLTVDVPSVTTSTIRWVLTDNSNSETALYINSAANTGSRLTPNLIFDMAGTGGTTNYLETGLTPNTAYVRYGEAFNATASSFSAAALYYTLANPPTGTYVIDVGTRSVVLGWDANGNPNPTQYQIQYSTDQNFSTFSSGGVSLTTTAVLSGLLYNTTYFARVRANNAANVTTVFDSTVSFHTLNVTDTLSPAPPHGIWAEWQSVGTQGRITIHWRQPAVNADGTAFDDPAPLAYRVYKSRDMVMDASSPALSVTDLDAFVTTDTLGPDDVFYYRLRTIDLAGNESADSLIVEAKGDGSILNVLALGSDNESRLVMPATGSALELLSEGNKTGENLSIRLVSVPSEEQGRVIKSLRYEAYDVTTGEAVSSFAFQTPDAHVLMHYDVENGQVAANAPAGASAQAPLTASQAENNLALFWFNGVEWTKVGGTVDMGAQMLSIRTLRVGRYQIRQALRVGPASLVRVYPRIFSPNGDGWNDKVVFDLDNPALVPISGEIFDISGAKVADMARGANPDSSLEWDGKRSGSRVPGGVYIYRVSVGGEAVSGTVVVAQ